jgi:diguanylate cyclase (GGDEF)-like protein/putative nucleotidyltransferase with HDIG domain
MPAREPHDPAAALVRLQAENDELRDRLESAERYTAQTLARATRLSQVISVVGNDADFHAVAESAAVGVAELYAADIGLIMLGADDALRVEGCWGVRDSDVPASGFAVPGLEGLTHDAPAAIGSADEAPLPGWLEPYGARHVAWVRLLVGHQSLGLMLLVRRAPEPFERSDAHELRAIAYRIALAIQNSLLQRRMTRQLERLIRVQEVTTRLAGMLELAPVGACVAEMLVTEVPVGASRVLIDREGELVQVASCGGSPEGPDGWEQFPLETPGRPVGRVDVAGAPAPGTQERELLLHLLGIAALALDKAILYERSREQARRDSLTGLLGHRVFHEHLAELSAEEETFSIALIDIDDFKQINDLLGHQTGDDTLRLVADALTRGIRARDSVFRVGGEEFCAILPGLGPEDAYEVAERLRTAVADVVSTLPVTVSVGVASHPTHALRREELIAHADAALYASKRGGKNRTTVVGSEETPPERAADHQRRRLSQILSHLHVREPNTVVHSAEVATLAVELGRELGIDDDRLADLRTAAQLHDIGKIAVPPEILGKPGPLDDDEYRMVQTHARVGAEMLRAWGLDRPARFVLEHHEHVDGSGYPAGLRGDEICLESRIIHVADAFAAMILERPYRPAMRRDEALDELLRHRGTQFDAAVVDAMLARERRRAPRAA